MSGDKELEKELIKKEALLEDYKDRLNELEDKVATLLAEKKAGEMKTTETTISPEHRVDTKQELERKKERAERRSELNMTGKTAEDVSLAKLLQLGMKRGLWNLRK